MLGEKLGDFQGQSSGMRVLPGDDYRYVKMEVSFQQQGTLFGQPATDMGTYTVFERVPGQLYGEGRGITMTADGQGAIWNGHGVGHMTGEGMGMTFRFAIAYQAPVSGALSGLNAVLVIGEHTANNDGSIQTSVWEWK
jgi:hypothetical protein